ncbi:hypothetical protein [Streptomyces violascens]|uniref:hypothetical protein n=1 Tax=Streptomyces violascens TaxID=67381 RepID=UPI00167C1253|nr:hypothetical protein [Streptomyces violascens]GGU42981.1 hypothetical protein GCM10010289_74730 [Streptomyces violascens]
MPESGHTWRKAFKGLPEEARTVRVWTAGRLGHPDAPLIANELFTAVLGAGPDSIEMTLSTAGTRIRIAADGSVQLSFLQTRGPGAILVGQLSASSGVSEDGQTLWALFEGES